MHRVRVVIALACAVAVLAVAASAHAAHTALVAWQSPTKNIGCVMDDLPGPWGVRCDIRVRSWAPPPRPKRCDLDFGQGVAMGSHGRAGYVCAGDTALGEGSVLPYGHSITRGPIRCTSTMAAMTCVNTRHHHGFVLSRQSVRLY
jgi:hypothetical protein